MPKKRKKPMTKVIPLKMDDDLYDRIAKAADQTGEAEAVIMRLILRAGLKQLETEQFEIFKMKELSIPEPEKLEVSQGDRGAVADRPATAGAGSSKKTKPAKEDAA